MTNETKQILLDEYLNSGKTINEICEKYNVCRMSFYRYKKKNIDYVTEYQLKNLTHGNNEKNHVSKINNTKNGGNINNYVTDILTDYKIIDNDVNIKYINLDDDIKKEFPVKNKQKKIINSSKMDNFIDNLINETNEMLKL